MNAAEKESEADKDKEGVYGVAWVIYNADAGVPDMSPSMYQTAPKVRHGTIKDMESYMESVFYDPVYEGGRQSLDPMRGGRWRALKVSKEGKAVYGNYSVPLRTWKLGERWTEKDLLIQNLHQVTVMLQDDKFANLKKEEVRKELEALECRGKEIVGKLIGMGVGYAEQLDLIDKYFYTEG